MCLSNYKIVIVSRDSNLEELVRGISSTEHANQTISTCLPDKQEDFCDADILFLELPWTDSPSVLRGRLARSAMIVACGDSEQIAAAADEDLAAADEIWVKPYNSRLARIRFQKLLEQMEVQKNARINQIFFNTLIECMPDMVWFKDVEGIHVKVNNAFCQTVGKTMEDVTGKDHCHIWDISEEDYKQGEFVCKETDEFVMRHREKCFSTEKVRSQHGMRQFNTYKAPLLDQDGRLLGTVGIGHDITALENMSAELELILRTMPFAILVWNEDGTIINTNEKFEEYFHITRDVIIGQHFPTWNKRVLGGTTEINRDGNAEARIDYGGQDNRVRILEIYELPIHDVFHNEAGRLCIYRDITKERELEEQIIKSSNTDFLTDLDNRRSFYQYIRENRGTRPLCLLYADLDQFKKVNDTFGHKAGDAALIVTARLLQECFPHDFIARIGGDEFLVAKLGGCSREQLEHQASHLLARMQQTFSASEYLTFLSASIGIACTDDPAMDIDELLRQSDTALYDAKLQGRARYCFYSDGNA